VRAGHLSLFLSLCIALVTGVVPLRVCHPTDGCSGGVVAIGVHAHDDHDAGHHEGRGSGGGPCGASCTDAPFDLGVPARPVTLDAPPAVAELLPVHLRDGSCEGSEAFESGRMLDVGIPLGTRSVVLLR
jgi:hypothetical protein